MDWLARSIRRAAQMDLADLEYVQRDPRVRQYIAKLLPGGVRGVARSLVLFALLMVRESFRALRKQRSAPERPIVFFSFTNTHFEALKPIARHLPNAYFTCANVFGRSILNVGNRFDAEFPLGMAHLAALPFAPLVLWRWITARGWLREVFARYLNVYWASYGFLIVAEWWLRRLNAAAVVVANDHSAHTRLFVRAAKAVGIPSFYVQHASVTERFPPLSFDHALLDGEDAARKYAGLGTTSCTAWLVGMSKLDGVRPHSSEGVLREVGVCTNVHDSLDRVRELCSALAGIEGLQLVLRARPTGPIEPWLAMAEATGMHVSRYGHEPVASFLSRLDAVIAGDSSILLEGALLDAVPLYYDFSGQGMDWYGFVERGLAVYAKDPRGAVEIVRSWMRIRPSVRHQTRYYCDTVDTEFDGRSGELAANVIRGVVQREPDSRWRHVDIGGLAVRRFTYAENSSAPHRAPHAASAG